MILKLLWALVVFTGVLFILSVLTRSNTLWLLFCLAFLSIQAFAFYLRDKGV